MKIVAVYNINNILSRRHQYILKHSFANAELVLPSYSSAKRDLGLLRLESRPPRVMHPSLSPIPNYPE